MNQETSSDPESSSEPPFRKKLLSRRGLGTVFLLIALVLLVAGFTVLRGVLGKGLWFVLYWLCCMLFTALSMLTALLDAWIIRSRARHDQQQIFQRTLDPKTRRSDGSDS